MSISVLSFDEIAAQKRERSVITIFIQVTPMEMVKETAAPSKKFSLPFGDKKKAKAEPQPEPQPTLPPKGVPKNPAFGYKF